LSDYKNIALIVRRDTPKALEAGKTLHTWLKAQNIDVFFQPESQLVQLGRPLTESDLDTLDLVIVLGGDGTYLEAVRTLAGRQTPIIGVNLGSLGFLTENRLENMTTTLQATFNDQMEKRARSVLNIKVGDSQTHLALNDLVIERGDRTHLINISIHCEGHLVYETKADGIIVASPTGSTAYNLASGGPILHPEVKALVITPICPHSLTSRPLIFPDDRAIELQILGENREAQLTIDGQKVKAIDHRDRIQIQRHQKDHMVIRHPTHNFFHLLREKLKFGERD